MPTIEAELAEELQQADPETLCRRMYGDGVKAPHSCMRKRGHAGACVCVCSAVWRFEDGVAIQIEFEPDRNQI